MESEPYIEANVTQKILLETHFHNPFPMNVMFGMWQSQAWNGRENGRTWKENRREARSYTVGVVGSHSEDGCWKEEFFALFPYLMLPFLAVHKRVLLMIVFCDLNLDICHCDYHSHWPRECQLALFWAMMETVWTLVESVVDRISNVICPTHIATHISSLLLFLLLLFFLSSVLISAPLSLFSCVLWSNLKITFCWNSWT